MTLLSQIVGSVKTQVFNSAYNHFSEPFFSTNSQNYFYRDDFFSGIQLMNNNFIISGYTQHRILNNDIKSIFYKITETGDTLLVNAINNSPIGGESTGNFYFDYGNNKIYTFGRITTGSLFLSKGYILVMDTLLNYVNHYEVETGKSSSITDRISVSGKKSFYLLSFGDSDTTSTINFDIYLSKIDSLGNIEILNKFGGEERELGRSIQVLNNGNMLIAGETDSYGAGNTDLYLFETDTLGNMLWQQTYGYPGNEQYGRKNALYVTPDEEFYLCGFTRLQNGNAVAWLVKTDRQGNMLWEKKYERGPFTDYFKEIHPAPDGTLIITGNTRDYSLTSGNLLASRPMAWVLKMDTSGNIIWERLITIHDDPFDTDVYVNQSLLAPDGGVVMAGYVIANYIETDGVLHLNDGWACKTDSCGYTSGDIPEPLFVIESQNDLEVSIDNLSEHYCTATLTWGDGEQEPIYAYSEPIYGYSPNLTHTYTQPGTYEICLEALAGEEYRTYCTEVVLEPNSLAERSRSQLEVKIFPNPTNDYFILELPLTSTTLSQQNETALSQQNGTSLNQQTSTPLSLQNENLMAERSRSHSQIYNLNGQLIHQFRIKNQPQQKIDISHLADGVYVVKIVLGQFNGTQKLVVVK